MTLVHTDCTPRAAKRASLLRLIATWADISRQRRALSTLTDAQLRDIGLTEHEAQNEANRAAWDVPRQWRR